MNALKHVVLAQEQDEGDVMVWTVTGMHRFHFSRFRCAIWVNVHLGLIGLAGMIVLNNALMDSEIEPEHVAVITMMTVRDLHLLSKSVMDWS